MALSKAVRSVSPFQFPEAPRDASPDEQRYNRELKNYIESALQTLQLPDYDKTKNHTLCHLNTSKKITWSQGAVTTVGSATLAAGTVTVSTANVTASTLIFLCCQTPGGTSGFLRVSARTAGTSFTILSSSNTDTSVVGYLLIEP